MSKVYIPTSSAEDWKRFLAEPEKQWKRGDSARALACCWQEADGIPRDVQKVLSKSEDLKNLEALFVIPEHKVKLPGGRRASQNDVWVLARTDSGLVSISVEGKVSESFDKTIRKWSKQASPGKQKRIQYLCDQLGLEQPLPDDIMYQLVHRTASAIIEAKRFFARQAVMVVHSFSQSDEWFEDYERFLSLFGLSAGINEVVTTHHIPDMTLHLAWVKGDKRFLEM